MPTLLYYPLVRPPQEVLHQALLYWDDFASLIPSDPELYEVAVSEELQDLRERGLYHPVILGEHYGRPLENRTRSFDLQEELRNLAVRQPSPLISRLDAFLFRSKLGYTLEDEIVRLGLGYRLEGSPRPRGTGLMVSREVRHLLLSTLTRELAFNTTTRAYTPYTDMQSAHETSLRPQSIGYNLGAWRVELGHLLPVPAPGTPMSAVLAFRDKYADERERLMGATQAMLCGLRSKWEHPADVLERMKVELRAARDDYQAAVRASRTAWIHRSISVTVGVASAAAGALVAPELSWAAGIAGSIGFNIATREVNPLFLARREHPFSYLHLIDRELT